ncbi:MAG: ABC transporter permease subunit, partial [Synechococcales cyanobacterium RU_4_20]|nr:ABC transporter permease subunit [Synechococcales cyanobacterium RU_4_20]
MARWVLLEDRASAAVKSASQSASQLVPQSTSQLVPQSTLDRQPPVWGVRVWGGLILGAIALALLPVLLPYLQDPEAYPLVNGGGLTQLQAFWQAALHPDLSQELLRVVGPATLTTLAYAVCGSSLSLLLGMVGGVLCSELWWESVFPGQRSAGFVWPLLRGLLVVPRGIHELLWGLILIHLWGTDPLTGIVAIALPFGAATAKIFSKILDDTPRAAWRSLLSAGASPLTALCYGILPQALLNLVSYGFYRFECSIRSAAVLGMIGGGGLGTEIQLSLQSLRYEQLWTFFLRPGS